MQLPGQALLMGGCGTIPHLRAHEGGRHILQLQRGELRQLLVDALEDVVVQVPSLVQVAVLLGDAVLSAPLSRLCEFPPICLHRFVEVASVD